MKQRIQRIMSTPIAASTMLHLAMGMALFYVPKPKVMPLVLELPSMKRIVSYAELIQSTSLSAPKPMELTKLQPNQPLIEVNKVKQQKIKKNKPVADKNIAKLVNVPASAAMAVSKSVHVSESNRSNRLDDSYASSLLVWLERHKTYPKAAIRSRIEGNVIVQFRIDHEGKLLDYKIIKDSGSEVLDQAVVKMLTRASPFPQVPSHYNEEDLRFTIPISFDLKKQ
jgi:protein TonB